MLKETDEATNNEAILVTDVGQNQLFACRYFKFKKYHSCITSGGCGTMGFGIPAAMGACYAAPDRTVCMFVSMLVVLMIGIGKGWFQVAKKKAFILMGGLHCFLRSLQ